MAHYLKSPPSDQEPRQRWAVVKRGMFLGTVKAPDRPAAKAAAAQRFPATENRTSARF